MERGIDPMLEPPADRDARTQAALEKTFKAEQATGWVRVAVVALASGIFYPLMDKSQSNMPLAVSITVVAFSYGLFNAIWMPYRRFPVMRSAAFTSVLDAGLIALWVYATGGFESSFYVIWYVSLVAIAFRYDARATLYTTTGYAIVYGGLLALMGEFTPNFASALVRMGYMFIIGVVGALLSRETLEQAEGKAAMRQLMLEARAVGEQLRARESQLRDTVAVLNATLDSTADGILVVNADGNVLSHNKRFLELWRIPKELVAGGVDGELLNYVETQLQDPQAFRSKVAAIYGDIHSSSFDEVNLRDGRIFERLSQPHTIEGHRPGRVWSFRDVTASRQAEAERARGQARAKELERLRELDEFKTRFINQVAHELWTPLTPIKLQLHLLRGRAASRLGPEDVNSIEMIDRNMNRLQHLVEEMLDGARLQAGRFRVHKIPIKLDPLIDEVVDLFKPIAAEQGHELSSEVDANLHVAGDSNRLTQVLYNLLSNAHKFTPRHGRVHVHGYQEQDRVIVHVKDTGIGMTPEQLDRLFKPFSQTHDTMQWTKGGTGLGLYISKAIVDAHGGTIEARSEGPGKGTRFTFWIPRGVPPSTLRSSVPQTASAEPTATTSE